MSEPPLPRGTVTFLFTDIEGSTRHLEQLGDRYSDVLARHRELILDACSRNLGVPVNSEGDALFVAFEAASNATAAAVEAQRSLAREPWPGDPLRVRMGLHTGEAKVVAHDYVGMAVHIAARIAAAGHGGQILVSDVTHRLSGAHDATDLGVHRLKDVGEHRLLQLDAVGLDRDHPPLRTLSSLPNNLPAAVDEFVGRRLELDDVVGAVRAHRLVTLTGAGGSGKTRLALEAGALLLPAFPDGVWLASLAAVDEGSRVASAVAASLRVNERLGETASEALAGWLRDRSVLLLLDNCEHVVDAVTAFCDVHLAAAPGMHVLATSREFLGVRGEHAIRTPPLGIPEDPRLASMSDAVELFLTRAEANAPDFHRGGADLDVVVRVCRRLDGLPLAIELAASRLRALSLEQLAARLDDRFRLLSGGSRSDLPRQRTLEAVVAWSYDLLNDNEREVFARLAVFPHHFSLEMAEAVISGAPVEELDVVDVITRLVEKSLVTTVAVGDGLRYRMLETLRQYALDRLLERGEVDQWRARLLAWSMERVDQIERVLRTPAMDRAMREATIDAGTHRAVVTWAAEHGREVDALRIVGAVPMDTTAERLDLLRSLLPSAPIDDDVVRGFAFAAIGNLATERGEWAESSAANGQAFQHFERAGLSREAAWSKYSTLHSWWGGGELERVDALVAEVVEEFRAASDRMGLGYALWVASLRAGDLEHAAALAAEADALLRAEDVPIGIAHNVEGRGIIALDRGETAAAARFVTEALERFSSSENDGCAAHALEAAAVILARTRADELAAELLGAADELRRRSGQTHRPWEVRARHGAIEDHLTLDDVTRERAFAAGQRHTLASACELAIGALSEGSRATSTR